MKTPFILALTALSVLSGCHHAAEENAEAPAAKVEGAHIALPQNSPQIAAFKVEAVEARSIEPMHLTGRVVWNDDVTVRVFAPFAGRVSSIKADVGQLVQSGDVLAMVASPDYGQAQADAHKAESDLQLAEKTSARLHELLQHGAAAQKDVEAADADLARAKSEKIRCIARLELYGGNLQTLDQLCPLKSPVGGIVVEKNINPGQEVRPDQMLANAPQLFAPLFVVTDPTKLWIQIDATENDLPNLKNGAQIVIHSQAFPNEEFDGHIDVVSDSLDPTTRTVKVRGYVDNAKRLLKAEMFVTAEIKDSQAKGVTLSSRALLLKGEKYYSFLEEQPGKYLRQEIKIIPQTGDKVIVLEGIRPGQRVVSDGCLLLEQLFQDGSGS